MSPDRLSSKFYWTVRKLGLPTVSLQGLRHTFATVHREIGTPLQVFSKGMGHSSIKTTADINLPVLDEQQVAAATRLDAAFRGADPRVRDKNAAAQTRKPRGYAVSRA
jgi:integrase